MSHRTCWLVVLLLAGAARATDPVPEAGEALRAEFRATLEHVADSGSPADSTALRGYLLYPYLEAARLRTELGHAKLLQSTASLEARIRNFLKAHGDEPVTRELTREWLNYLGEHKRWLDFQMAVPAELTELSLRCHALSARLALQQLNGLREAALELWLKESDSPPACESLFAWLDTPERVAANEIEQRARLAALGRAPLPLALKALPPERRALMKFWDHTLAAPDRELQQFVKAPTPKDLPGLPDPGVGEALLEAFDRIARRDSHVARQLYEPLRQHGPFTDEQRNLLLRSYALGLAYDFDPEALKAFADLPDAATDGLAHEWRVRIALRLGDFPQALRWLEAMPPAQRQEPRWRYWRARALERDHPKDAKTLYAEVAKEREYYAFLAAERLGRKPDLRPKAVPDDAKVQGALAALPAMQRARELLRCELDAPAALELRYALKDRSAADKTQAAHLIETWGWHEPAVRMLSELQQWDDLVQRFPLPYDREIDAAAHATQLAPEWLYAVLRTESLYGPRAASAAGALGLLQLRLATARQVAQRAGLPRPEHDDLFKPEVNIGIGARYVRELQDRFGQRFIVTLAAYNAGPQRTPYWLSDRPLDAEIWIETIPYNETRQYVQRALSNLVILSWRRRGQPAALLPLLGPVAIPSETRQDGPR